MTTAQIIQFLVIAITILGPVIVKGWQKVQEARVARERQQRAQQAQFEALRTGRDAGGRPLDQPPMVQRQMPQPFASAPSPFDRPMATIGGSSTTASQTSKPATRVLRLPGGVMIEVPVEADARPAPQRTQQQVAQKQQKQQKPRQQQQKQRKQQPVAVSTPAPQAASSAYGVTRDEVFDSAVPGSSRGALSASAGSRSVEAGKSTARVTGLGALLPANATREDFKKAIVLSELFGRPVGSRE